MNNIRTLVLCTLTTILIYAGMQMFSKQLASSQPMTLIAGFIGSHIFVFVLTGINSIERMMLGDEFQSHVYEVVFSIGLAAFASVLVHRVSMTVCVLCSLTALYYMNKISEDKYTKKAKGTKKQT
ncbi:Keratinocyte-associated protein 2 [Oopsacas minuta]|uniref:Keratinocyte-associated protein 2 n=1 Tax=Oopsacas minuta TaxID=111878 RepID=A0AAV7KAR8_9METZ|nr:Keratinocyte-associated protein 2 [Oopsacas minuta]